MRELKGIIPLHTRVLVRLDAVVSVNVNNLTLPDSMLKDRFWGCVERVGPDVEHVLEGDRVLLADWSTRSSGKVPDEPDLLLVLEADILAIETPDE